ncbi:hypothetical protein JW916_03280 [Candidatus Sumerlaeota bacterium]|nr:hypothetical protein [Candidatus Sumerlaeota bacterium]
MIGCIFHFALGRATRAVSSKHGRTRIRRGFAVAAVLVALAALASGCSRLETAAPLTRRVVVMDFRIPRSVAEKEFQIKGWWFGAHTIFQNPRAGEVFADALALQLHRLEYLEQHSRTDLKFYMEGNRQRLQDRFKGRPDGDYDRMLSEISPVDYGLDLGVDQVITGRLIECFTSQHRTIQTWYSQVKVEVQVWDMKSARAVWNRTFFERSRFASQSIAMQRVAGRIVKALDRKFYRAVKP